MFDWGQRTFVMGVLNLTPDSFSGDGLNLNVEAAIAQAQLMRAAGADVIDVGGESTHPKATPVSAQEEMARVLPVIEHIAARLDCPISVDTYKASVARAALAAGAAIVNDVWGLRMEPDLAAVVAEAGAYLVVTRNARPSTRATWTYQKSSGSLIEKIIRALEESLAIAERAGVARDKLIVDPGIGFGEHWSENLIILRDLARLRTLGHPILVGPSRKEFIRYVLGTPTVPLAGTAATVSIAIAHGADMVRLHDVPAIMPSVRMTDAITRSHS